MWSHLPLYLIILYRLGSVIGTESTFGSYRAEIYNYTQCSTLDTASRPMTSNVTWVRHANGTDSLYVTATLRRTMGPFGMRLRVSKQDPASSQFVPVINYRMKNICEGVLAKEIFRILPNVQRNCTVSKGTLSLQVTDLNRMLHQLTGATFYYGFYQSMYELTAVGIGRCMCTKLFAKYVPLQ